MCTKNVPPSLKSPLSNTYEKLGRRWRILQGRYIPGGTQSLLDYLPLPGANEAGQVESTKDLRGSMTDNDKLHRSYQV